MVFLLAAVALREGGCENECLHRKQWLAPPLPVSVSSDVLLVIITRLNPPTQVDGSTSIPYYFGAPGKVQQCLSSYEMGRKVSPS